MAETKIKSLEENLRASLQSNVTLDSELQKASQTIVCFCFQHVPFISIYNALYILDSNGIEIRSV